MMRAQEVLGAVAIATIRAAATGRAFIVYQNEHATFASSTDEPHPAEWRMIATVMPNHDVTLHDTPSRPVDPDTIPLPKRPGTLWQAVMVPGTSTHYCANCKQDYSHHGAPAGEPVKYGLPADTPSHLMCRWTDDEWAEFNRQRQRATVDAFIANVRNDLDRFSDDDRITIVRGLVQVS